MGEDVAWAGETSCRRRRWRVRGGLLLLQGLDQNALHSTHVDEVHLQCPAAGGIQALSGVALPQADELVSLPDSRPGSGTVEEALGELGHRRSQLGSLALDGVGAPQRVGAEFGGVVGGVGGAAAPGLARMDLDQLAPVEDAHQLQAQADLHLLPGRAQGGGHGVEGIMAGHVVVLVDLGGAPVGDLVGHSVPGQQGLALLVLEDLQGLTAGGAVDAQSGNVTAPALA